MGFASFGPPIMRPPARRPPAAGRTLEIRADRDGWRHDPPEFAPVWTTGRLSGTLPVARNRPFRHDVLSGLGVAAASSRSRSGRALSRSQSRAARSSRLLSGARSPRSRSVSSTAQASMYRSSCNRSSSSRRITTSLAPRARSAARWRETQSHCRHRWLQNSRGRPGPDRGFSTRRHHRHRSPGRPVDSAEFVMTKY